MAKVRTWLGLAAGYCLCSVEFHAGAVEIGSVLDDYRIRTWNEDDGLPYHCVCSMTQTAEGYLWYGTFASAVRFDGVRFTTFDAKARSELPEGVNLVYTGKNGGLWVGMPAGIARYKDGVWRLFGKEAGWPGDWPRGVGEDRSGNFYFCAGRSLLRFDGNRFVGGAQPERGSDTNSLLGILVDQEGDLWARGDFYLGRLTTEGWQAVLTPAEIGLTNPLMGFEPARGGGIWVAHMTEIRRWRQGKWDRTVARPEGFRGDAVRLLEDSRGNLWVGCYQNGVFMVEPDGVLQRCTTADGLLNNSILMLFEDSEGHTWIGTNGGGLAQLKRRVFQTHGKEAGLSQPVVNCLVEESAGRFWVGTHGGSLLRFEQGRFKPGPDLKLRPGVSGAWIYPLALEKAGMLWVGTLDDGLFRISGGAVESIRYNDRGKGTVTAIFLDSGGRLWCGTDDGVYCLDRAESTRFDKVSGLEGTVVSSIAEDGSGRIWFADSRKEGAVFRQEKGGFERYTWPKGKLRYRVNTIYRGKESLWFGGSEGHLGRVRGDRYDE